MLRTEFKSEKKLTCWQLTNGSINIIDILPSWKMKSKQIKFYSHGKQSKKVYKIIFFLFNKMIGLFF